MSQVKITFTYTPEDPDEDDSTGVSNEEFERVHDRLSMEFGAEDIQIEKT